MAIIEEESKSDGGFGG
jgi:hypothetical protein